MIPSEPTAVSAAPFYSVALISALSPIAIAVTTVLNRRHGAKKDADRKSGLETLQESITEKLERHQSRTEQKIDRLRETLTLRIDEVEASAENAQRDATKALHASIGVDGENGNRGELQKV